MSIEVNSHSVAELKYLVAEQAADEAIWLLFPTASEAYILQALRKLHAAVEALEEGGK